MNDILRKIIESGAFELVDMLEKLDVFFAEGKITEDERAALVELAREKADPDMSKGELANRVSALEASIDALVKRVEKLEGTGPEPGEVADYVPGARYYKGDRVRFEGAVYEAVQGDEAHPVVWSPSDYPAAWKKME